MLPGGRLSLLFFRLTRMKIRSRARMDGREQTISFESGMGTDSLNLCVCVCLCGICLADSKQFESDISASYEVLRSLKLDFLFIQEF